MKTIEEIFEEIYGEAFNEMPIALKLSFLEACKKTAIAYANQKLDEAKLLMPDFDHVNKNLLDSLKDKV